MKIQIKGGKITAWSDMCQCWVIMCWIQCSILYNLYAKTAICPTRNATAALILTGGQMRSDDSVFSSQFDSLPVFMPEREKNKQNKQTKKKHRGNWAPRQLQIHKKNPGYISRHLWVLAKFQSKGTIVNTGHFVPFQLQASQECCRSLFSPPGNAQDYNALLC